MEDGLHRSYLTSGDGKALVVTLSEKGRHRTLSPPRCSE